MRRLGSLFVLVLLVVGTPSALLIVGFYRWDQVNLWAPADVRIILGLLTCAAWIAWAVFAASVLIESVRLLTSGRIAIRLPGLSAPQALAGALLTAIMVSSAGSSLGASAAPAVSPVAAHPSPAPGLAAGQGLPISDASGAASAGEGADLRADPQSERQSERQGGPQVDPQGELKEESAVVLHHAAAFLSDHRAVVHIVKHGDDLWSLAQRYYGAGNDWRNIVKANPEVLSGDPTVDLVVGTPLAIADPLETYQVKRGDTLWGLAEERLGDGRRFAELQRLNADKVKDPDRIEEGWTLKLPPRPLATSAAPTPATPATPAPPATPAGSTAATPAAAAPAPAAPATPSAQPSPAASLMNANDINLNLARGVAGGLAALSASAIIGGLLRRRRERATTRPLGRTFVDPAPDLARFETALGLLRESDREKQVERAMRRLAEHWWNAGEPAPRLQRAVVGADALTLTFDEPCRTRPEGFALEGPTASITWEALQGLPDVDRAVAFPALVTLGSDAEGQVVLVDLVHWGVLGVDADEVALTGAAVSAMVVELSCVPWADELSVRVVTAEPGLVQAVGLEDLRWIGDAEEGVRELERRCGERRALLDLLHDRYDALRLDPNRVDAWAPLVMLFELPLTDAQLARINAAIGTEPLGIAAVVGMDPVGDGEDDPATILELVRPPSPGAEPVAVLVPFGLSVSPQTLPPAARQAIAGLYENARALDTIGAPWWQEAAHASGERSGVTTLRPSRGVAGPRLRLFGAVALEHPRGEAPSKAKRQCLEYLAWLMEHPAATASEMTEALFIADGTRRSNLSRLRGWLGHAPDGEPYLPDAYSGRITLHRAVSSDWREIEEFVDRGVNHTPTERLREALELVVGAPLADAAPGQWAWADPLRAQMVAVVRDIALVLAASALADGLVEDARWACLRGITVAPDDELLACQLMRIEDAAGRPEEVRRIASDLQRSASRRGVDLGVDAVAVMQELVEGRPRVQMDALTMDDLRMDALRQGRAG